MSARMKEAAEALVEDLFADLNNRSGFDTGHVDAETLAGWKADWAARVVIAMKNAQESEPTEPVEQGDA